MFLLIADQFQSLVLFLPQFLCLHHHVHWIGLAESVRRVTLLLVLTKHFVLIHAIPCGHQSVIRI
jgi:hypothetical protein